MQFIKNNKSLIVYIISLFFVFGLFYHILIVTSGGLGGGAGGNDVKIGDMTQSDFFSSLRAINDVDKTFAKIVQQRGAFRFYVLIDILSGICFALYLIFCKVKNVKPSVQETMKYVALFAVVPLLAYFFYDFTMLTNFMGTSNIGNSIYIMDGKILLMDGDIANYIFFALIGAGGVSSLINFVALLGKPFDESKREK